VTNVTDSYYKFNLDTINLYTLIRFEHSSFFHDRYMDAYNLLRRTTDDHGNAHFNMIDRALRGPDAKRDAETVDLLDQWLERRSAMSGAIGATTQSIRHATTTVRATRFQ
jgi:hypothetical protein